MARKLSHIDAAGRVRMVNVSAKRVTARVAIARSRLFLDRSTLELVRTGAAAKGNVLVTAHLAGVMAAKRTAELIPLAHTLPLDGVDLAFQLDDEGPSIAIEARVTNRGRTGCEMEALTAASVAALTLYDMLKAVDRGMVIGEIALWEKRGGARGRWRRER